VSPQDLSASRRASAQLRITARPHWVNAWFVVPTSDPFAVVDGTLVRLRWNRAHVLTTLPGEHQVTVFLRYKRTRSRLGATTRTVTVAPGEKTELQAQLSWLNQVPFRVTAGPPAH
jgi:hypothetical protein